ncbi:hypothetical protein BC833DRAFT_285964 [Globomyces pollinis-pini]|nr:hypothetical protein BC833DRAFT_285964 [Globomyces pollinis-pini]
MSKIPNFIKAVDLERTDLIVKIISPIATVFGFISLIFEVRSIWGRVIRKHQILLILINYLGFHISFTTMMKFFYPDLFVTPIWCKAMTFWAVFLHIMGLLLADTEMLKLMYVITPFSVNKIQKFQIVEICVGFVFGGGLIFGPLFPDRPIVFSVTF